MNTHQIVDFGPGPQDQTLGYPVEGSEAECEKYAEELNANYPNLREDGGLRFCVQEIPQEHEPGCSGDCERMPDGQLACATPISEV